MLAVIKTGGKQYNVSQGDVIEVEKLDVEEGEEIVFDEVLLYEDDEDLKIGEPTVEDATVKAEVLEQGRGEKKIIFKYKPKSRQKKKKGHRQPFTRIEITDIEA